MVLQLATRGDLTLTELRLALYLAVLAGFKERIPLSGAVLAAELGANSTHVAGAAKQLARLGVIGRVTDEEPYKYRLKARKKAFKSIK